MKKVIQILLAVAIVALAYFLYLQLMTPIYFQREQKIREAAVIERIKDIRTAERAYKQAYLKYTGSFDTLVHFLLNDSLEYEKALGSADDSVAVAKGLVKKEKFKIAAIDTVFGKKYTIEQINDLELIPYGEGSKYVLEAGMFTTESQVVVPVFECKAPFKDFLGDLDNQELINLIDDRKAQDRYPGIKVGSLERATNDEGNWE